MVSLNYHIATGELFCVFCILTEYFYMCYAHEDIRDNFQKLMHCVCKKKAKTVLLCLKNVFLKSCHKIKSGQNKS